MLDGADISAIIGPIVAASVYGGVSWHGRLREPKRSEYETSTPIACTPT
jgi:hypothetical protein